MEASTAGRPRKGETIHESIDIGLRRKASNRLMLECEAPDTARRRADSYASLDRSDPFTYARVLSHLRSGLADLDDYVPQKRM